MQILLQFYQKALSNLLLLINKQQHMITILNNFYKRQNVKTHMYACAHTQTHKHFWRLKILFSTKLSTSVHQKPVSEMILNQ